MAKYFSGDIEIHKQPIIKTSLTDNSRLNDPFGVRHSRTNDFFLNVGLVFFFFIIGIKTNME